MLDRRHEVAMREFIVPIIVAMIVGIISSLGTAYVWVNVLDERVKNIKEDVSDFKQISKQINASQIEIQVQLATYVDQLKGLTADRYTASEATRMNTALQSQIDEIKTQMVEFRRHYKRID